VRSLTKHWAAVFAIERQKTAINQRFSVPIEAGRGDCLVRGQIVIVIVCVRSDDHCLSGQSMDIEYSASQSYRFVYLLPERRRPLKKAGGKFGNDLSVVSEHWFVTVSTRPGVLDL